MQGSLWKTVSPFACRHRARHTVIRLRVRVPVLSKHTTWAEARFPSARSRRHEDPVLAQLAVTQGEGAERKGRKPGRDGARHDGKAAPQNAEQAESAQEPQERENPRRPEPEQHELPDRASGYRVRPGPRAGTPTPGSPAADPARCRRPSPPPRHGRCLPRPGCRERACSNAG